MNENSEINFLDKIKDNIKKYGHHVTFVTDAIEPRYAYTIGVDEALGFELIFAGGLLYTQKEVLAIINEIVIQMRKSRKQEYFEVSVYGAFKLLKVHDSWSKLMMLGFFDYYKLKEVHALQVIPDPKHITLDVPNMSFEWSSDSQPIWKWLSKSWNYSVPEDSRIITNINSLRGEKITEVIRWEENEWEAFAGAGPDVKEEDVRIVSLGTLLGIDASLEAILNLAIGKGIWRDSDDLVWHEWSNRK